MKKIIFLLITFLLFSPGYNASNDIAPNSKSAILLELSTGKVLYEKNSHEKLPPASMTKVMSMLLIMEAIDDGVIRLSDEVLISDTAASMGGSQVFLEAGDKYPVEELLKGIAIASGNDAVVAMAEKVSGSVGVFVERMNQRASELGMKDTVYKNPHGLDEEGHITTAYDMALVAKELLKHEKILEYTGVYEYYLTKPDKSTTWLVNTNKLVRFYDGVDGLKTGFTQNAKYCLTATAKKNQMRLITVVMGVETSDLRSSDTVKMLNFGFNGFKLNMIKNKGDLVKEVKVKKGVLEKVNLILMEDATDLLKNDNAKKNYKYELDVKSVTAPIKKGDEVGKLKIIDEQGEIVKSVPVTVQNDVKKAEFFDYFVKNFKSLLIGKNL